MRHQVLVKDFRLNNKKIASLFIVRMIIITALNQSANNISIIPNSVKWKTLLDFIVNNNNSVPTLTAITEGLC